MTDTNQMDPNEHFSTPFDAPLVPLFPFRFRNVWILTAIYRTNIEAARRLVPPPLEVDEGLAAIHIYQMNDTEWFGSYNESAVQLQVRLPDGSKGAYSPYLLLDHDGAIAAGREVYGQPKKYGKPSIEVRRDLVVGSVARNGIDVVTITTPYKTRLSSIDEAIEAFDFVTNVNLKIIPAVDTTSGVRELTARDLDGVDIHEIWSGPGTVELRPNAQVPVYHLEVEEMVGVFYWNCDFTLDGGRTIHTYEGGTPRAAAGGR